MTQEGILSLMAAFLAGAASAAAILAVRRRVLILALLVQFAGTTLLLTSLPLALLAAYAVVGACVVAILAVTPPTQAGSEATLGEAVPSGFPFRLIAVLLVGLAAGTLGMQLLGGVQDVSPGQALGAGLLFGLGLLHLGLLEEPVHVGAGLVSLLGGFQIGYAAVEPSVALHALLIAMPILIALVVAYLSLIGLRPAGGRP